jgi:hypothetical protein
MHELLQFIYHVKEIRTRILLIASVGDQGIKVACAPQSMNTFNQHQINCIEVFTAVQAQLNMDEKEDPLSLAQLTDRS